MKKHENTQMSPNPADGRGADTVDLKHLVAALGKRSIVLVGIMGCGKSTVGKRLAQRLGLEFVDADSEIERAANMTVSEIFSEHGEPYFRSGEERVIARLLQEGPQVLATGGGAFISDATRSEIETNGLSIWLKVDFETVMARVRRRSTRPLLRNPDPEGTMRKLMAEREPVYAQAQLTVTSKDVPHEAVVDQIVLTLADHLYGQG
ncbi:shikimate kinase [Roseibium alexandrii]|uniref:Shikimate kinase n=1 Tax=Roseibium alexandrii (strain DSM 17067 / NCIMB 14079 / DFL-11) TaxID=244592 RepID=A0A5E8GXX0_ROSAD|nr:Shikimate kinase [Roseibium alexandrii DFL-11]